MTEIDFARWPLLTVSLGERLDEADLGALAEGVRSALERRARFVLAIAAPPQLLSAEARDAAPLGSLRRRRAEVGTWCRGVAYVVAAELDTSERDQATRAAELLWGCPVHITEHFVDAVGWLRARL